MGLSETGNLQSNKLQLNVCDSKIASSSRTSGEAPAGSASDHDPRGHVAGQPASSFRKKTLCKNCGREITRWFDAEYWIGKPGEQIWTHDDFVDGTDDGHCDGISCKNETADQDATEAQPVMLDFYRPRFLVLPTGRPSYSWGIWDSGKNPLGSIPTSIFRMKDFVSRHRDLGLAYKAARKLNERVA